MTDDVPGTVIREATRDDAAALVGIYNHYVRDTVVTFEEQPVGVEAFAGRIADYGARWTWLLAERDGQVVGYAYGAPWQARSAYRHSVECTVYLAPGATGRGDGTRLYTSLLERLRARGAHAAIGGIALPNAPSVALHEKLGFRQVAHYREVGRKFDRWIDVGYWQLMF